MSDEPHYINTQRNYTVFQDHLNGFVFKKNLDSICLVDFRMDVKSDMWLINVILSVRRNDKMSEKVKGFAGKDFPMDGVIYQGFVLSLLLFIKVMVKSSHMFI